MRGHREHDVIERFAVNSEVGSDCVDAGRKADAAAAFFDELPRGVRENFVQIANGQKEIGIRLPAAKARDYGLVNEVFDTPEACLAAAMQCAKEIVAKPPVAIWGTKQVIHYARDHSVDDALRQMGWVQGAIWSNAHVREAVTAMKTQRDAQFPSLAELKGFGAK